MYLTHRLTKAADLGQCFQVMSNRLIFGNEKSRKDLMAFWRFLLSHQVGLSAVTVDHERPAGRQIVGFGMSLFATEEFAQAIQTHLPPYLPLQAVRWWRQGRKPFLGPKSIARKNAEDSLSLVILHFGTAPQKGTELDMQIRAKMHEAFIFTHGGYHLKQIFQESYTPGEKEILLSVGLRLLRSYREKAWDFSPDPSFRPCLLVQRREDAETRYSVLGPIFLYPRPRFGFKPVGRRVLQRAVLSETDKEIGKSLGLSVWTVKKCWQEIYDRVEKTEPGLLSLTADEKPLPGEIPVTQRRRIFLNYIRGHLEEIRPFDPLPLQKKPKK